MHGQRIEDIIGEVLMGDAQRNAFEFVAYLKASEMQFEREKGYWEDKFYWTVCYKGEIVCTVLIGTTEHSAEPWVVWSDSSGSKWYENSPLPEHLKEIAWENVDICGGGDVCGGYCGNPRGICKKIFGRDFNNVCLTVFKFDNPNASAVECLKNMADIRKNDILSNA
ncbi:MAG: hypothetical protein LBI19_10465 [Oscillospiraceae bacterium]|jgi:hypothetical protein|nr:hypothetical protein [Oscillospiraceae bacterium]